MTRCQYCGGPVENKNNVGHFRKFCLECAQRVADGESLRKRYDPDEDPLAERDPP